MALVKLNSKIIKLNSKLVTMIATSTFDDWFLPSDAELNAMWMNLHSGFDDHSVTYTPVGGFSESVYWSSSEIDASNSRAISFFNSSHLDIGKDNAFHVRAARAFTSGTVYAYRSTGPGGGLIFYANAGNYKEAAPSDQSTGSVWSNITDQLVGGTSLNYGTGMANTDLIIGQPTHFLSAAKICKDLVI